MDESERFMAVVQTDQGLMLLQSGTELNADHADLQSSQINSSLSAIQGTKDHSLWTLHLTDFDLSKSRKISFTKSILFTEWITLNMPIKEALDIHFEPLNAESFFKVVETAKGEMADGGLKKIVPCVFEVAKSELGFCPLVFNLLKRLQVSAQEARYQNSFAYAFIDFENEFAFLGLTPELLFHVKSQTLNTMALAGTFFENKGITREEFLVDPKETSEHLIVVADIKERVVPFGKVKQGTLKIKKIGALEHLLTEIHVLLTQKMNYDLCVKTLHPTAALGVYPKAKLDEWRDRLACGAERKYFGSPFGVETPDGQFYCYVAIRNIEIEGKNIRIGAGCGIVSSSDPKKEWQELKAKRESVKGIFRL